MESSQGLLSFLGMLFTYSVTKSRAVSLVLYGGVTSRLQTPLALPPSRHLVPRHHGPAAPWPCSTWPWPTSHDPWSMLPMVMVPRLQIMAYDLQTTVYGLWLMASALWPHDLWSMAFGVMAVYDVQLLRQ